MITFTKAYRSVSLELYLILNTILITSFLGFIDDGYYNFNWIFDVVAIVALTLYGLAIYAIQFLAFKILFGKYPAIGKYFSIVVSADLIIWMIYL